MNGKEDQNIKIKINVQAVRNAAKNAETLDKVSLMEIEVINPNKLTLGNEIFGLTANPLNDKIKIVKPSTLRYVAIRRININNLSNTITPDHVTVNSDTDIPTKSGEVLRLNQIFLEFEDDARQIARILTENELVKVEDSIEERIKAKKFYTEQLTEDRF